MPPRSGAIVNACVHPMRAPGTSPEPWSEEAQAILWRDGVIALVGSTADVEGEARKAGITPQDAGGKLVLPGFVDAHTHFLHIGVKRHRPDLSACTSKAEALAAVATWLNEHPGGEPVIGERWDESSWVKPERPMRSELDALVAAAAKSGAGPADRMVVLRRVCGHIAVANTAALAPIRRRWDDDAIVDPSSGLLLEQASLYLNEVIPTSPEALDAALAEATKECLALGITTVGDYSQAPYREALQRAAVAGRLGLRVASSIYVQQLDDEVARGFRSGAERTPFLRDGGLKVFLDGSLGAHTAALREPYGDHAKKHPNGMRNWSDEQVATLFARADQAAVQIHAHAIGDAAIDQGLAGFADLAARADVEGAGWSANPLRHRFEHFEIAHDDQLRRTAELAIVASSQPNFVGTWSSKGGMYEARLGPRFALNNRFRTMLEQGIPVAFGSDGMPPGPLQGIAAAGAHPDGAQRMEFLEAVWHYTWWAAWSLHWDDLIGSLERGKRADFVVLGTSGSPQTGPDVLQTFSDGRPVHHRPPG
ncbi:MAG: amidohydrolase [bacterium]